MNFELESIRESSPARIKVVGVGGPAATPSTA